MSGRRLAGAAAVVLAILVAGVLALSAVAGWFLTHPGKKPLSPAEARLGLGPAYEEVVFPSREDGLELRGWFMPAAPGSGATVVMAHGYGNNREMADLPGLAVAGALVDAGFNVLMFDFRNAGESAGTLTSVGQFEQRDLLGALDYVCGRGAGEWVGLLAYSMGAVTGMLVAADDPRVHAVVADAPFADLVSYLEGHLHKWSPLPAFPFNRVTIWTTARLTGLEPALVSPVRVVDRIAPRPLLFIHGEDDAKIPYQHSLDLYAAAGAGADLWLVPGAGHVGSYPQDPEAYLERVIGFFEASRPTHL